LKVKTLSTSINDSKNVTNGYLMLMHMVSMLSYVITSYKFTITLAYNSNKLL